MRILILVDCYLPSTKSSAKLVHDLGVEFRRQGHAVSIAAPDETLTCDCQLTEEDGVSVLRIRTGRIKGASKVMRAINEVRLSRTFWRQGEEFFRSRVHDLVVYYSPTIFFGPLVSRLKTLWNCPAYLILRDIFPQWAVDAGVLRKGPAYAFFRWCERRQYAAADVIGVQSPANLEYFHQQGGAGTSRLEVLYNWTPLHEEHVPETCYRQQWGLDGKTLFFYGGNLGIAQDLDNLLRLAERLRSEPRAHLLFVGEGSEVPRLEQQIRSRGLSNVSLRGALSQREYLGLLNEVDVGLISLDRKLKTQNVPGKLLGYLSSGLPVLASLNPGNDLRELVGQYDAGLVSENGEDDRLFQQALSLARDAKLRQRLGNNGRRLLAEVFAVEKIAGQILEPFTSAASVPFVNRAA